jgi:hypothetical protein
LRRQRRASFGVETRQRLVIPVGGQDAVEGQQRQKRIDDRAGTRLTAVVSQLEIA